MKRYIYIITDKNRINLHVGLCSDLKKTLEFYKQMPTLFFDVEKQLTDIIYMQLIEGEEMSLERYKTLCGYNRKRKLKICKVDNPKLTAIVLA